MNVPPYLSTGEVAEACEMPTRDARRMLERAGILERLGGHWSVAESRLRERLPDVYDRVFSMFASRDEKDTRRQQRA